MWTNPDEFPQKRIEKITVPTLIIQGGRDTMIPVEEAVKKFKLIPKAELSIIPNAYHDAYKTKEDLFNSIVLNFLTHHSE